MVRILLACVVCPVLAAAGQTGGQPLLPQTFLEIGDQLVRVEIANTPETMAAGLMHRTSLPPQEGMLFVFPYERTASFWMRNTRIPLSIAYIDREGRILEIHDLTPFREEPVRSRSNRVLYALEMNRGWFESKKIGPGEKIKGLPKPRS
jgi:uncharacterized membrane protein (UPF0127 family)